MAIPENKLRQMIENSFPEAEIFLKDLVGDQDHYEVVIKSSLFDGKSKIEQHRMVNEALNSVLGGELHALSIKTKSTE